MRALKMIFFLSFTFLFQINKGFSQLKPMDIVPAVSIVNDVNLQDWYLGFAGGIEDLNNQWGLKLGLNFRPFRRYVQIQESDDMIRQYREKKYFLYFDLDKRFIHFPIGEQEIQFFAGVRPGLLWGDYSGTKNDAESYWLLSPMGGVAVHLKNEVQFKVGYVHMRDRLINVGDGRITFSFLFPIKN
jgi:hypothetical protein